MAVLKHTPKEITERKALRINPAKTCQPIGAMYAALGINKCLPHSHGSQGCCAYHRSHLTRHYKDPVMASTSSFTEGSSVFGGQPNLRNALKLIFSTYEPEVVAVHTTCLSETIGDDIPTIIKNSADDGIIPEGKMVIHANTPSYVGSHVTGYANMVEGISKYFGGQKGQEKVKGQVNLIPGWIEPSDMAEIKRIADMMGVEDYIMFPDTSKTLATPQTGEFKMYPEGGTKLEDLKRIGVSEKSIAMGEFGAWPAAVKLDNQAEVPFEGLDLPVGVNFTDKLVQALAKVTGKAVPEELAWERGRLVDMMVDYQQYLYGTKVAIWGDPDQVVAMTEFICSAGMKPVIAVTGTPGKRFTKRMEEILASYSIDDCEVRQFEDLFYLHQYIKNHPVDLLIGNTYGKHIARAENLPFVRYGFPVLDRVGHSYFPSVGYTGGMYMLTQIINTLLDRFDEDSPDERFELIL